MHATTSPILADRLWPASAVRNVLLVLIGSLALVVSAKVQVPFWPVPMTMQTFAVLVIASAFGARLGAATVALYLAEGAIGLPVFAGTPERGIGLAYMVGPTGGYLVGFLLAAIAAGWLGERGWGRGVGRTLVAMVLGTAIIFACGLLWLGVVMGWGEGLLQAGLIPFLPGALLKIALAAAVLPLAWRMVGRHERS